MAAKSRSKQPSARARGLRTLQHQTLAVATRYAIDTEVWFRGLLAEGAGASAQGWATKDQVHDEALALFLKRHARVPFAGYAATTGVQQDLTFWLDAKLMQRARRMAARDGVKVARLIEVAFAAYVKQCIPEQLLKFRRRAQRQACAFYQSLRRRHEPA